MRPASVDYGSSRAGHGGTSRRGAYRQAGNVEGGGRHRRLLTDGVFAGRSTPAAPAPGRSQPRSVATIHEAFSQSLTEPAGTPNLRGRSAAPVFAEPNKASAILRSNHAEEAQCPSPRTKRSANPGERRTAGLGPVPVRPLRGSPKRRNRILLRRRTAIESPPPPGARSTRAARSRRSSARWRW